MARTKPHKKSIIKTVTEEDQGIWANIKKLDMPPPPKIKM